MRSKSSARVSLLVATSLAAKRRTPMPAKITFAGENTYISESVYNSSSVETYQTDALRDGGRKCVQDVHSWDQPPCQPLIATASSVEFTNLVLKHGKDGAG
ncbi:hypothetical protein EDB86DRAFT_2947417 [Lactarius hatsudake]|nr:hypothetical protein EDB86DRAFT_2947417 [Lactarius hatsudake]